MKQQLRIYNFQGRMNITKNPIKTHLDKEWTESGLSSFSNTGSSVKLIAKYVEFLKGDLSPISNDHFLDFYMSTGVERSRLIKESTSISEYTLNNDYGRSYEDLLQMTRDFYVFLNNKGFFNQYGNVDGEVLLNYIIFKVSDSIFYRIKKSAKVKEVFNNHNNSYMYFDFVNPQIADTVDIDLIIYSRATDLMCGAIKIVNSINPDGTYTANKYEDKQERQLKNVYNLECVYISVDNNNTIQTTVKLHEILESMK